jgi:hypothetical protein
LQSSCSAKIGRLTRLFFVSYLIFGELFYEKSCSTKRAPINGTVSESLQFRENAVTAKRAAKHIHKPKKSSQKASTHFYLSTHSQWHCSVLAG